jgi:hypothetical protein
VASLNLTPPDALLGAAAPLAPPPPNPKPLAIPVKKGFSFL